MNNNALPALPENPIYWFAGAMWNGNEDQLPRFLEEGIWENGYEEEFVDQVLAMRPGEKIAIKAAFVRKHNLPFQGQL